MAPFAHLRSAQASQSALKTEGSFYTNERLVNARRNIDRYDWAKAIRNRAVAAAKPWLALSDEQLWSMVPGQDLPRVADTTMTRDGKKKGCLKCGSNIFKFGHYPYIVDVFAMPWKLKCPSCGEVYPKNDFGKYYQSGLDERGLFQPSKADRSLLFNTEHPDPQDPLHLFGVDDGFGYKDETGHEHRFIAYYTHWGLWTALMNGLDALTDAYVYTGDGQYAHKAAVLLDRIGDVYPDYDWAPYAARNFYHSDGGSNLGKIQGCIWETSTITTFASAVDKVVSGVTGDTALFDFLAGQSKKFKLPTPKGSFENFWKNVEDNILRYGAQAVLDRKAYGNEGMHQLSMAWCAIALDKDPDTTRWLDWIFQPEGGHIPEVIVGGIDRDGVGAEAAPGYALSWGGNIGALADLLADYGRYKNHDIYRDFPQFRKTFTAGSRMVVLDYFTPSVGDAGACMYSGKVQCDPSFILRGYRYTGGEECAVAAYKANGNSSKGLIGSIFDKEPEELPKRIDAIIVKAPLQTSGSHHTTGYGLMSLESGAGRSGRALWMYFGRNGGHGHQDRLNIGLQAFVVDLLPPLGYPELMTGAWPHTAQWMKMPISHNVVVVDQSSEQINWCGLPRLFKAMPGVRVAEVDGNGVYPQTQEYRRLAALIDVDETHSYAVDIFRVVGGKDHLYSIHGPEGAVTTDGLKLVKQPKGSYAGEDVEPRANISGPRIGYSYLYNVERDAAPPAQWNVDWKVAEKRVPADLPAGTPKDLHLRLTCLTQVNDVALADGDPPQNRSNAPKSLRYVLAHRAGEKLTTTFVSLLEPYAGRPQIQSVTRLPISSSSSGLEPVAIKIQLTNGDVDYVVSCPQAVLASVSDQNLRFLCAFGFLRVRNGKVVKASIADGSLLMLGDYSLNAVPAYAGIVDDMDVQMTSDNKIYTATPLPTDGSLVGQEIYIANDNVRSACYQIRKVTKMGDRFAISVGDVPFVRDFKNTKDYSAGYVYDFQKGARFRIPNHTHYQP